MSQCADELKGYLLTYLHVLEIWKNSSFRNCWKCPAIYHIVSVFIHSIALCFFFSFWYKHAAHLLGGDSC